MNRTGSSWFPPTLPGALVADMRLRLERDALNEEISRLELFGEDDPV